jgi:uncharacterized protein with FMN-binding domain
VIRRRHAAKGSRAVALALSVGTSWGLAGYLQHLDAAASAGTASSLIATPTAAVPVAAPVTTAATPAAAGAAATAATPTVPASGLSDGTYVGESFTNRWGVVQVQMTVSGGTISSVDALQLPNEDGKSVSINSRAYPQLVQMSLTAQSADVDTVSGATYTSEGYRDSLQTAIDAARAAATS